jgi:hypothetical protein
VISFTFDKFLKEQCRLYYLKIHRYPVVEHVVLRFLNDISFNENVRRFRVNPVVPEDKELFEGDLFIKVQLLVGCFKKKDRFLFRISSSVGKKRSCMVWLISPVS